MHPFPGGTAPAKVPRVDSLHGRIQDHRMSCRTSRIALNGCLREDIRDLICQDKEAQQRLRQLIEAGLTSGPATPRSANEVKALFALAEE